MGRGCTKAEAVGQRHIRLVHAFVRHDHAVIEDDEQRICVQFAEDDAGHLVQTVVLREEEDEVDDRREGSHGARLDCETHDWELCWFSARGAREMKMKGRTSSQDVVQVSHRSFSASQQLNSTYNCQM